MAMKIAVVTNNYKPYSGGVVSSIDTFAQHLAILGHQVYIITLDFEGLGSTYGEQISIIRLCSPVRFNYRTFPIAIPWLPQRTLWQTLQEINPQIVHSQHPFLLGVAALKASRKLGIPILFTHHSQYEQFAHLIPFPQLLAAGIIRKQTLAYCQAVDGVVAPSNFIQQLLRQQGCKTPVRVIPSGILPIYLSSTQIRKPIRQKFQLLTVSRFAKEKNIPFLLEMFAMLPDPFHLNVVGYGPEEAALRHYAYTVLQIPKERLTFIERPTKPALQKFYQTADLFVFASTAETQGLVLAEAMASGTPVIALAGPGQDELVINGKNGFLINSQAEMALNIQKIFNDPNLHWQLQKGAFASGKNYAPARLTQELVNFYQDAIGK